MLATLGGLDSAESRAAQQDLFFANVDDPWMQVAALSAGPDRAATYLEAALRPDSVARTRKSDGHAAFFTLAGSAVAATREPVASPRSSRTWRAARRATRGGRRPRSKASAAACVARTPVCSTPAGPICSRWRRGPTRPSGARRWACSASRQLGDGPDASAAVTQALALAADPATDAVRRADAISLAALGGVASREAQFEAWVDPREPEAVQVAALAALTTVPGEAVGRFALHVWPTLTPAARTRRSTCCRPTRRASACWSRPSHGRRPSWAMNFWQKRDLIMHRDPELRAAARALLEDHPEARAAVVNRYAAAVERGGDAERGRAVFAKACAACHKIGDGTPSDLGPDLSGIRHRPPLALLVDVLSPNQAIAQGYETYLIERTNGRSDAGTLAEQTPTTVTLRQAGQPILIPRSDIKTITMLPQSSMPADLDKVVSPAEMADLLAFLTKR